VFLVISDCPSRRSPCGMLNHLCDAGGAQRCALSHLALVLRVRATRPARAVARKSSSSTRSTGTAIWIVATLHVFGGFFFPGSWPRCARYSMPAARRRG
jgi:hypothetical protein